MAETKWTRMAEEMDLRIPKEEVEAFSAVLDRLYSDLRPALDRDLSTVEPVGAFRPDGK